MGATRALLLAASQNRWLRNHAGRYAFVKRSVSRFMPGETLDDAISAAHELKKKNIASVLTHLGENILDQQEAEKLPRTTSVCWKEFALKIWRPKSRLNPRNWDSIFRRNFANRICVACSPWNFRQGLCG